MSRYIKKRFIAPRTSSPVRVVDGREICLGNEAGRAEYRRRKQILWGHQRGACHQCGGRMSLLETRMTGGDWSESDPPQLRDDRIEDRRGVPINHLVHKECLRKFHDQRSMAATACTDTPSEENNPYA
jgi:hypothetical protein